MHPEPTMVKATTYTAWDVIRIMVIGVLPYATILTLPALLAALARAVELTDRQIGWIGSAELLGVTCGSLIIAHQVGRRAKVWLLVGAALVGVGNLLASQSGSFIALVLSMWLVGIGAGLGGGFAYKSGGQSANPMRFIALLQVCQLSASMLGYQILSALLPRYGIATVLQGYAALGLAVAVAAATLTVKGAVRPGTAPSTAPSEWSLPPRPALIVLSVWWFFCCAEVGLYAFLERIGVAHGFAAGDLSNALSGFAMAGVAASVMIAAVPAKWPRGPLLIIALMVGEAAVFGIFNADTVSQFGTSCAALGLFFLFTIPIVIAGVSRIDPTGRSTALAVTVGSTGQAIGPGVAGMLVVGSNYSLVGWFTAVCFAVSILSVMTLLWRFQKDATRTTGVACVNGLG